MMNSKRIVLVRPGVYGEGLIVPLGLLYLAGYLNSKITDLDITIIDAALQDLSPQAIAEKIKKINPGVVGLTGMTLHSDAMKETARCIRKVLPGGVIVAGGAAATSNYAWLLAEHSIDFAVLGEGEEAFYQIVKALRQKEAITAIGSVAYRDAAGKVIVNPVQEPIENLDLIPMPAYPLISVSDYFNSKKRNSQSPVYISKKNLPILTSRGCPFGCIYCHNVFGKKFRSRSAENVVREIIWLTRTYKIEELEIVDDIFNYDILRAKEIMRGIINAGLGLKISFPNGIKYEMLDDEMLFLFKQAGVYRIAFGIESANKRMQKILRKEIDLPRIKDLIRKSAKAGFFVSGFFQLGLPGEGKEEMGQTIDYAASTSLHTATFHLTIPFPGTPMYQEYVRDKFIFASSSNFRSISVNVSAVSNKELLGLKKYAYYKFYFNPRRIINIYKSFPVKKRIFYNFINILSDIFFQKWVINA